MVREEGMYMGLNFDYGNLFERIWKSYPIKVGKMAGYKAFQKLNLTEEEVVLLTNHVEIRKREDIKWIGDGRDQRFVPHLATFLNQARWLDEYEKIKAVRSLPGIRVTTDEENHRAWALDQHRKGLPVPESYQRYLKVH